MARPISQQEARSFKEDGYLVIRDLLSPDETRSLQLWAKEVHDWPTDESSPWMPYAEINASGERVLCRTENYASSHSGLNSMLRGNNLLSVLRELAGEDMVLFKEKINYKLAGSGGFAAHIDSTAYTHVKKIAHLSILLAVDATSISNGCLEVMKGSHNMDIPIGSNNCIEPDWVARHQWTPVELGAGQILIFGSYLAHRSAANNSNDDRKALYATYNRASEGDLHDEYYRRRRIEWPPTHVRKPGEKFEAGALRYGYGSPMLSIDLGHQLAV